MALNITIQTYAGHVDFGIIACPQAAPHTQDLARAIEAAFQEGRLLFAPAAEPAKRPRKRVAPRVEAPTRTRVRAPGKLAA
jgi:hypothetical protein